MAKQPQVLFTIAVLSGFIGEAVLIDGVLMLGLYFLQGVLAGLAASRTGQGGVQALGWSAVAALGFGLKFVFC